MGRIEVGDIARVAAGGGVGDIARVGVDRAEEGDMAREGGPWVGDNARGGSTGVGDIVRGGRAGESVRGGVGCCCEGAAGLRGETFIFAAEPGLLIGVCAGCFLDAEVLDESAGFLDGTGGCGRPLACCCGGGTKPFEDFKGCSHSQKK